MHRTLWWGCAAATAALVGCSSSGPDVFPEAEALQGQGKLEEAAAKFELVCGYRPKDDRCPASGARAAQARLQAAEKAIADGRYLDAEKTLLRALATADGEAQAKITSRLGDAELTDGVRYERAVSLPDKEVTAKTLEELAAAPSPEVSAKAKAWLAKERPAVLIQAVKAACGPAHKGSCTGAFAKLKEAKLDGPEAAEAVAMAEAEERRVYPLRQQAENFLTVFASQKLKDDAVEKCIEAAKAEAGDSIPTGGDATIRAGCREQNLDPSWYEQRKTNDSLWRRLLRSIADPELSAALQDRKREALSTGGPIKKLDIPKPKPAPKKP